ncbi:NADH-dependent dehydrogenase [Armatimonadota bacterium]|nr:NADH-dependent dehydrogenase [Armatimonadota bacterium]
MSDKENTGIDRREFLYRAGLGTALLNITPESMAQVSGGLAPNEKINVAGIGVGSQGGSDIDAVAAEGHNIVALCDVDFKYAAKAFEKYPQAKPFKDYRVMFEEMGKEIDAVVIGTPDHTHAVIAMEAMRHGKHVYCEKPLAHTVHEVRTLMAAAHKYKVVTQLGNQGHSFSTIRRLCEWVWAGAVGQVHTIHAGSGDFRDVYNQSRNLDKIDQHYEVPPELDYDLWLGPAQFQAYTPFWVHWNWRGWLRYGTGTIGDWFCHVIDPSFWALDLGAPTSVLAEVTDYDPAKQGLTYPPGTKITFEFPAKKERGPIKLVWHDGNNPIPTPEGFPEDARVPGTGAILIGDKGMIVHGSHGAGGCRLVPDKLLEQYSGSNTPAETIPRVKGHHWDWLEAIRTGREAGSNFGYGGRLTQVALLGAIAIRFPGETLLWDDKAMRFTNNRAANAYLKPAPRKGWKL